jgi:hypothetical protein
VKLAETDRARSLYADTDIWSFLVLQSPMKVIFFTVRDDPSHHLVHSHYPLVDDLYGHCIPFLLPPLLTLFLVLQLGL